MSTSGCSPTAEPRLADKRKEHSTFTKILIGYDDSSGSRNALDVGLQLGRLAGPEARVTVVAIAAPLPHYGATVGEVEAEQEFEETQCHRWLTAARAYAAKSGAEISVRTRIGHPAQELLRIAEALGADLIVLGHSGGSGVWGRFLGSTAEKVSRHAHCSVLIAAPTLGRGG